MRYIVMSVAALGLAACGSMKERAYEECLNQAEALPGGMDPEKVCSCATADVADDATVDEANDAMMNRVGICAREAAEDMMAAGETGE